MKIPLIIIISLLASYQINTISVEQAEVTETTTDNKEEKAYEKPISVDNGKFFYIGENYMLYGGKDSSQHFKIDNCILKDEQFHYGIGREEFPALLNPEFISVNEADSIWNDTTRFLLAYSGNDIKAYSVKDLTRHEIVNDELNEKPIMAAYCILADLGAIYTRTYGDKVLTFGLSGYTYHDDEVWGGVDGFVFWDRETESLWWPLVGKAVSGSLLGVELKEMDEANWMDTDWKTIKEKYPTAQILKSGQDYERPATWQKITDVTDIIDGFTLKD